VDQHPRDRSRPAQPAVARALDHQRPVADDPNHLSQDPIGCHPLIAIPGGIPFRICQAQHPAQRAPPEQPVDHMTEGRVPEQHEIPDPRAITINPFDFRSIPDSEPRLHAAAGDRETHATAALENLSYEVDHHTRMPRIRHRVKGFIILHFGRRNILRSTRCVKDFSPNVPCFRAFWFTGEPP
jgi:hypothetical protein